MEKTILFVQSEEERATRKDLVSFHKSFRLVFNEDCISRIGISKGMYATVISVDREYREIKVEFTEEKKDRTSRIVGDPKFSKRVSYLSVRISPILLWEYDICLLGAFKFSCFSEKDSKIIYIKY